jgi:hypothetical protein
MIDEPKILPVSTIDNDRLEMLLNDAQVLTETATRFTELWKKSIEELRTVRNFAASKILSESASCTPFAAELEALLNWQEIHVLPDIDLYSRNEKV